METLRHNDIVKQYQDELAEVVQKATERQEKITPVEVSIKEDCKSEAVVLTVGGNSLYLTAKQARDLAYEIRRSAVKLEKDLVKLGIAGSRRKARRR